MKKLLILFGTLFMSAAAFANIELDINYYGVIDSSLNFIDKDKGNAMVKQRSPFGLDMNTNFFFGSPAKFNAGLNIDIGFDTFNTLTVSRDSGTEDFDIDSGSNFFIKAAPAFRFNLNKTHSFYIAPGLSFSIFRAETDMLLPTLSILALIPNADINIGYRAWLLNTSKFSLGVNCGFDFTYPLLGFGKIDVKYTEGKSNYNIYVISGKDHIKCYIGLCMNFGNRF